MSYALNSYLLTYFMILCFIEPALLPVEVLHCGNRDFRSFCSCNLDLDPMTFIILIILIRILWRYTACAKTKFLHQSFRKLSSDRHRDIPTYTALKPNTTPLATGFNTIN